MQMPVRSPIVAGSSTIGIGMMSKSTAVDRELRDQVAEAGDHAELALAEPLERRLLRQHLGGERLLGVAQQRQHLLQRVAGVVGGERQRGRLVLVVEDLAATGVDERRQPAQRRRDVEAGLAAAGAAGVLGRGLELLVAPRRPLREVLVVDVGHVEAALAHRVEVDEGLVVVDDHRRDAVGHALELAVAGERLERRARVAVAEVHVTLVEQRAERPVQLGVLQVREVLAPDQEQVGHLALVERRDQVLVGAVGLDLDLRGRRSSAL